MVTDRIMNLNKVRRKIIKPHVPQTVKNGNSYVKINTFEFQKLAFFSG